MDWVSVTSQEKQTILSIREKCIGKQLHTKDSEFRNMTKEEVVASAKDSVQRLKTIGLLS